MENKTNKKKIQKLYSASGLLTKCVNENVSMIDALTRSQAVE